MAVPLRRTARSKESQIRILLVVIAVIDCYP